MERIYLMPRRHSKTSARRNPGTCAKMFGLIATLFHLIASLFDHRPYKDVFIV